MNEQDREKQWKPVRRQMPRCKSCLDELIHQHGNEHISTLVQLISLTTRVETSLTHNLPRR